MARFKSYVQEQTFLLPPSLEELVPEKHPVRVVNKIIEGLDLSDLYRSFSNIGSSAYHPKLLLKGIIFAYLNNIYSSRRIEEAIRSNIYFMWLCGMQTPDHNTIARFRTNRLADYVKPIFSQIVMFLAEEGILSLKTTFIDGTKIEANANKYTFVWQKSIIRYRKNLLTQLQEIWDYAKDVAQEELKDLEAVDFSTVSSEKLKEVISEIQTSLKKKRVPPKMRNKISRAKNHFPAKLEEYKEKESILAGRRSYSKTDEDAVFMRMKDDHLRRGQVKAAYNAQISTNNQYITSYGIYQTAGDSNTLINFVEDYTQMYNETPETLVADAGYGSEENYLFLEEHNINPYVKYNMFDKEINGTLDKKHPYRSTALEYVEEGDYYLCPDGRKMFNIGKQITQTVTGFKQHLTFYQNEDCTGCPLKDQCNPKKSQRKIQANHRLNKLRQKAYDNLVSEDGASYRVKRTVEPEPVFGNIKQNKKFTRFMLRGKEKVEIEFALISIAHNMSKYAKEIAK